MNDVLAVSDYKAELDHKLAHLHGEQHEQIRSLINEYNCVISDRPGCCENFVYKEHLKPDATPVQSHPYRLSPDHNKWLRGEMEELLAQDLIEPTSEEWASPVIVVAKPEKGKY